MATSQLIESVHVTVTAVLPVFVTLTLPEPFGPPTVPVYTSEDGETLKLLVDAVVGGVDDVDVGGAMINVTGMVCPLLVAPSPKTVMEAE